ncbi:MAG TPA: PliI family lysozyme inhibitor of I-type lysozyme [Pseudomonadales bacterium]
MIRTVSLMLFAGLSAAAFAASQDCVTESRFVQKVTQPSGQTAVITEGDCEARSLGSYSVRLYRADPSGDDATFYQSGLILERDGTIESVRLADLDGDGRDEMVVVVRSVGTGGYVAAQAFSVANNRIEARSSVKDLPADADPVAALTKTTKSDKVKGKGKYHDPVGGAR